MKISLKERENTKLEMLSTGATFKIPESSFVYMRIDVDGLATRTKKPQVEGVDADPYKVQKVVSPEGKTPVLCVNNGKTQFMNLSMEVDIVELEANELLTEKENKDSQIKIH